MVSLLRSVRSTAPSHLVGTLTRWDPDTNTCSSPLEIHSNEQVYVGRDKTKCRYFINDVFVSKVHIWIYCIIFDDSKLNEVPPLIFAHDLSRNGTFLNGFKISQDGVLLSNRDELRIGSHIHLRFTSASDDKRDNFTSLQTIEIKVS
ncbi:CAMK protein kinase [Penicillium taxi]|uniref:CAMK protein kinase n=1 Tax=Penicillium taxi TaxID=168475 RepID=UPI002544F5A8|nr:CAMK protein kinase [Penicillium taxi]KAJ5894524.1 CAMK protein kinase [Penicillium taxi]